MGLQKYRADVSEVQSDGATLWHAHWMGGRTLSKITNCQWESLHGQPRVTAYVTSEPDTYFSIPAKARHRGCVINGYITSVDGNLVFNHVYYE